MDFQNIFLTLRRQIDDYFESWKDRIDTYIRERIREELDRQYEEVVDRVLKDRVRVYLREAFEEEMDRMVEGCVHAFQALDHIEDLDTPDMEEVLQHRQTLTDKGTRLLAICQVYRHAHQAPDREQPTPTYDQIYSWTDWSMADISGAFQELETKGYIRRPQTGQRKLIEFRHPLDDPSSHLDGSLQSAIEQAE